MTGKELSPVDIPKPPARRRGGTKSLKKERQKMGQEAAAIAYVQMENGEYRYPEGAYRQFTEDGLPAVNKREVMRRAGYKPGSLDHFDEYLGSQDEFWELVELHRIRRTDPMWRTEKESVLWKEVGNEALRNLYERVFYYPHELSTEQHIKIVKLILDAGITLQKMGADTINRSDELIKNIPEDKREKMVEDYRKKLLKELESVSNIEKANRAADREGEL